MTERIAILKSAPPPNPPNMNVGLADEVIEDIKEMQPGAMAASPHTLPWAAWKQIGKRMWVMSGFHNLSLLAAGTAFFVFLAITPLLAATVMTYGLLGNVQTVQNQMKAVSELDACRSGQFDRNPTDGCRHDERRGNRPDFGHLVIIGDIWRYAGRHRS